MSQSLRITGDARRHDAREGYAFFEDAVDATRYVQRLALLRRAQYHGWRGDPAGVALDAAATGSAGERL
ncbi:MAG: hypothetical protein HUJ28_08075 [Chromatiales bacterium]|nr:hypothetical protein [Chromatiales bacterium]